MIKKQKVVKRASINPIKRKSIRIVRRKNIPGIPSFSKIALKLTKKQLIDRMAISRDITDPTYIISKKILQQLHGMSSEDIDKFIQKYRENQRMRKDLETYYKGDISPDYIIQHWGHKGLKTKSDVDIAASANKYDIPSGNIRTSLSHRDEFGTLWSSPLGQQSFSLPIWYDYRRRMSILENKDNVTDEIKKKAKEMFLLDIAYEKPEYAAMVSYILNGGNPTDDISKMIGKFSGESREKFITKMRLHKLERSRDPGYKVLLQQQEEMRNLKHLRDKEHLKELEHLEREKKHKLSQDKLHQTDIQKLIDDDIKTLTLTQNRDKFHPDLVDKPDDYNSYDGLDRKKRKSKIKMITKKPIRRIIKNQKSKCRCK